jgi:hypothetical protein
LRIFSISDGFAMSPSRRVAERVPENVVKIPQRRGGGTAKGGSVSMVRSQEPGSLGSLGSARSMDRCPGDGFVEFVGLVGFVGFVALHAGPWLLGDLRCRVAWELLSASGTATPGPGTQWAQRTLETLRTRRASSHELRWVRGEGARVGRRSAVHGYSAIFVAESLGSCFQRVISQLLERAARRSLLPSHCSVALGVTKRVPRATLRRRASSDLHEAAHRTRA